MLELTSTELDEEIAEKMADLQAFIQARDVVSVRCYKVRGETKSKLLPLHEWAGAHAIMNTFDVVINDMRRLVDELKELRSNTKEPPRLRIVRSDDEQSPSDAS